MCSASSGATTGLPTAPSPFSRCPGSRVRNPAPGDAGSMPCSIPLVDVACAPNDQSCCCAEARSATVFPAMSLDDPRLALPARRSDSIAPIVLVTLLALVALWYARAPLLRLAEKDASAGGRVVHALVVDATTGRPIAGANVSTIGTRGRFLFGAGDANETRTGPDGTCTLRAAAGPESGMSVLVAARGYQTVERRVSTSVPTKIAIP